MAVSGLHNVSDFGPFADSPRTRASSLLQMWREIEGEQLVSQSFRSKKQKNGSDSECVSTTTSIGNGSENGDYLSQVSDESANQVFSGSEDNHSVVSEQSSDLGEMQRERVRQIFQEWMNSGPKGHSSYGFELNNRTEQWLGENERIRVRIIREWAQKTAQPRNICISSRDEVCSQIEQVRDGLVINEPKIGEKRPIRKLCGRQTLIDLLEKAQNERKREILILSEQRPVSNFVHRNRIQALLRGRFLRNNGSVLERRPSSVPASELCLLRQKNTVSDLREGFLSKVDSPASTSSNNAEPDSFISVKDNGESEFTCREGKVQVIEAEDLEVLDELDEHINVHINDESPSEFVDIIDSESHEVINEHSVLRRAVSHVRDVVGHITNSELNTDEEFDSYNASAQGEDFQESVTEIEDIGSRQIDTVAFAEWDNGRERGSNQSLPGPSDFNNVDDQDQIQEPHDWPSHDLQEAIDSWLDMPSEEVGTSIGRLDTLYFPDDDNVQSMELRELLNRGRVSGLLSSGFRQSLDQVLQSHVERLAHASDEWELDDSPFLASTEQNLEQIIDDQVLAPFDDAERNSFAPSYPLWGEDLQGDNWPHYNSSQQLEEYDVINELRIDMARLQHRMNDMQNMLQVCMGMQIELQRSVHQEVSAALNRSIFSRGTSEDNLINDESEWDCVRRGICCLCQDSKIDSMLYRCGHMCACAKCAENLVKSKGKCPMCHAPTVEAVRAYFIQ